MLKKSKVETARNLAEAHRANEPNLRQVRLLDPVNEDDPRDPIKLLEVVEGTLERGIEAVTFPADPSRGIDYPVLIIEVSPREYKNILTNPASLRPHGWSLGSELIAN